MSHTQGYPDNPRTEILGSVVSPRGERLSSLGPSEASVATQRVRQSLIHGTMDEFISYLMDEMGLYRRGFLGCILVPDGDQSRQFTTVDGRPFFWVTRTVPVWVIRGRSGEEYLSTNEFVRWLRKRSFTATLESVREDRPYLSRSREGTLETRVPRSTGGRVPLPSLASSSRTVRPARGLRTIGPEDSVSEIGDVSRNFRDNLSLLESEFRSTPRVQDDQGRETFDPSEYLGRLDSLNAERRRRSLRSYLGTPSTYTR